MARVCGGQHCGGAGSEGHQDDAGAAACES